MSTLNKLSTLAQSNIDFEQLSQQIVDWVGEEFHASLVGMFFVNTDGEFAILKAATGEGGKMMLSRGLKFSLPGDGHIHDFISESITHNIVCVTDKTGVFYSKVSPHPQFIKFPDLMFGYMPFLPHSRFSLSIPLHARQKVFAVLYLEHTEIIDRETIVRALLPIANKIEVIYTAG